MPEIAETCEMNMVEVYDHYKSKEAIIRDIFFDIEVFSVEKWWAHTSMNHLGGFSDFMRFYFGSMERHRFFFREFSALLTADPILDKEWTATYDRIFHIMREVLNVWVKQDLVKPFLTSQEADIFIESIWILAMFSGVHLEHHALFKNQKNPESGMNRILLQFLWPYHTEKGRRVLSLYSPA